MSNLRLITIYDHPKDHPDHFVARGWSVIDGKAVADLDCKLFTTLIEARDYVQSEGCLNNIFRMPDDDPVIRETWI